ncbi:MAG: ribonuclease HII [Euryarchaeota archaeon HGW-Euryarchaeota-1]|nr:MAG: ribonuclease HII [Euryarchaeota archaeon HGW-Euryarchaeota-1]
MTNNLIGGIDEAGRGCVIGPLVVCFVAVSSEKLEQLRKIGVKDSKLLSPEERAKLSDKIRKIADAIHIQKIEVETINKITKIANLNQLEIQACCKMIEGSAYCEIYIDSPETNLQKFEEKIKNKLENFEGKIIAKNKADRDYVIVGAASIIAKVARDNEIKKLQVEFGDFGSGYPSDEKTICFLKEYYEKKNCWPSCARTSWDTIKQLEKKGNKKQDVLRF